jgi:hypothetical protein
MQLMTSAFDDQVTLKKAADKDYFGGEPIKSIQTVRRVVG